MSTPPRQGPEADSQYRTLEQFRLGDLEGIRLLLRGGSVIDWHRLNFPDEADARDLIAAHELRMSDRNAAQESEATDRHRSSAE